LLGVDGLGLLLGDNGLGALNRGLGLLGEGILVDELGTA